jgi:hypothetical protein
MYFNKAIFQLNGILTLAICLTLFACGPNKNTEQDTPPIAKDTLSAPKSDGSNKDQEEGGSFTLPSPLQIASIFKKAGLRYYPNVANPFENASKYNAGKISQALNLGIYSADLSYCTLNKQNQESKNYMKASRALANQLGLEKVFESDNLAERFEKNLGSDDSLASIISEMQMQTDMILEEHEQTYVSATVFAGAWIESMYIGGKIFEKGKDKNVSFRLVEQMAIADNIVRALRSHEKKDPALSVVIADMAAIRDIFRNFSGVKALAQSQEEIDYSKIEISEAEMSNLIKKIDEVRGKIVKG